MLAATLAFVTHRRCDLRHKASDNGTEGSKPYQHEARIGLNLVGSGESVISLRKSTAFSDFIG